MLTSRELWLGHNRMCDEYPTCKDCPACLDNDNSIHDGMLCDDMERVDQFIDVVEQWLKDNPIITNRQKFKEVFGHEVLSSINCKWYASKTCDYFTGGSNSICRNCPWWDEEYKEVK